MLRQIEFKKKGVSPMISYILLISIVITLSVFVYGWITTYIPKDVQDCPDGTSIFIKEANCLDIGVNYTLSITLKNNGRFNIAGYFIHATNANDQELATIDLSSKIVRGGTALGSSVLFADGDSNTMTPNQEKEVVFEFDSPIYSLEILPIRFQEIENKKRLISCGKSLTKETVACGECINESIETTCGTWECGTRTNNCGTEVDCPPGCGAEESCSNGTCIESCGDETCDEEENCLTCPQDCGECVEEQIIYIGFENSEEINNWIEDLEQNVSGETLVISGTDVCSPKVGSYMLSGTGDFDPNITRYNRTTIDVSDYINLSVSFSIASEATESGDRFEFYYFTGSSWTECGATVNRGSNCNGWEDFECNINLDEGVTNLQLGVGWETSAINEHGFWDDINITGIQV